MTGQDVCLHGDEHPLYEPGCLGEGEGKMKPSPYTLHLNFKTCKGVNVSLSLIMPMVCGLSCASRRHGVTADPWSAFSSHEFYNAHYKSVSDNVLD